MVSKKLTVAVTALVAAATLFGVAGCGSSSNNNASSSGPKTFNLWQNSMTGPGQQFWKDTIKAFEAKYPQYKITLTSIPDNQMDQKTQTGLSDQTNGPNILFVRGGAKNAAMVKAGQILDLSDIISSDTKTALGGSLSTETTNGKPYAVPVDLTPEGFWYNKDLWTKAGLSATPTTIPEFETDIATLKAKLSGISPIAVGGKDGWPAAHYWYNFAMKTCSTDVYTATQKSLDFSDPCYTQAGDNLTSFINKSQPFNPGWQSLPAQNASPDSAGLVANQKAVMELQGSWEPGVLGGELSKTNPNPPAWLGFFPFPDIPGGSTGVMMAGADGYACTAWTDKTFCGDFLNFLLTTPNQVKYATAFTAIPAVAAADTAVTNPALKEAATALSQATTVNQFMDTQFGSQFGVSANSAMVSLMTGSGSSAAVVQAATQAAKQG
jgi:ABC-type glycerol-3-phosphate transport system substrate-binding protein